MIIKKIISFSELLGYIIDPRKDIEIFGMFGAGNLGDEAMLVAALEKFPKGRCTIWRTYPRHPFLTRLVKSRRRAHLVVVGGTLIHGGDTGWLDYVEMRFGQGSQISFFGTGVAFTDGEVKSRSNQYLRWSKIIRNSEFLHLRGKNSVEICRQMGGAANEFGDFAFLLYDEKIPVIDHNMRKKTVGVNVGNCQGDQDLFENEMAEFVRKVVAGGYKIGFHAVTESDYPVIMRLVGKANLADDDFFVEKDYQDPRQFMKSIRYYSAFVGLKMHAAGLAMAAGVPAMMIAYLPKCNDFMSSFKNYNKNMLVQMPVKYCDLWNTFQDMLLCPSKYILTSEISKLSYEQSCLIAKFAKK